MELDGNNICFKTPGLRWLVDLAIRRSGTQERGGFTSSELQMRSSHQLSEHRHRAENRSDSIRSKGALVFQLGLVHRVQWIASLSAMNSYLWHPGTSVRPTWFSLETSTLQV